MNINVFLLFCSSVFLQIVRERERERGYIKLGMRRNSPKVTYLISLMEFLLRIFLLLRADKLYLIFNTGLKNLAPSCPRYFLSSSTRSTGFGSVYHEPCPKTNFLIFYFRWRKGVPTSILGSKPIVWLLPSSFPCQATRVTSPSTNIWPGFVTFDWPTLPWCLTTVNSNKWIVVIFSIVSVGYHVTQSWIA